MEKNGNKNKIEEMAGNEFALASAILKKLEASIQGTDKPPKFNPQQYKDETRANIALTFTWGFFVLVAVILIGVPIYNLNVEGEKILDVKDLLNAVSGVIGVPFGFVVGYYFKGSEEK